MKTAYDIIKRPVLTEKAQAKAPILTAKPIICIQQKSIIFFQPEVFFISNNKFDFFLESIIFNREHGCDFNKWISEGVPYLNNENLFD